MFEPNLHFSLVVFFVHVRHFSIDFLFFFLIFHSDFLEMVFPVHSSSVLGLVFCLVNENSLNCTSELVSLCFFVSSSDALFRFTFVRTAKLKKSKFLNDFFLSLTAFARLTSFFTLARKIFCVIRS